MGILTDIVVFLREKWYFIALGVMGIVILVLLIKQKKRTEYYNEIKDHHQIIDDELKFNKTIYKNLFYKGKKIGQVYGKADKYNISKKKLKVKSPDGKEKETEEDVVNKTTVIGAKMSNFLNMLWFGKTHIELRDQDYKTDFIRKAIHINSKLDMEYYLGYYAPLDLEVKLNIYDNFNRTMLDKTMNGMGNQMRNFSEVRDIWGHMANMKQMEIEAIKEEKKLMPTRAR